MLVSVKRGSVSALKWWTRWMSESVKYDVCIVGGGPAGLSAAIRTKQLALEKEKEISVCLIEKGSDIGSHILSGCVMDPRALDEMLPDWRSQEIPLVTEAKTDRMYFMTENRSVRLPVVPQLRNKGCYIVSLSALCRWMGTKAEELGVDVFSGFAAERVIRGSSGYGAVTGVKIRDQGVNKEGRRKSSFVPGIEIEARATLLGEGCRGSISEEVMETFGLREDAENQSYGLGVKEVWEVSEANHKEGTVIHTIGFPLDGSTYGGGFVYHMADRKVAVGLVAGLDYRNPYLSVFQEFQRFKNHRLVRPVLEGGQCIQYGARSLNEGGLQCIPKLNFPGGALIGCSAGFMNSFRLKGTHGAMKSGILAAEALVTELDTTEGLLGMGGYPTAFQESWLFDELQSVRNVRPLFRHGLYIGLASAFIHGAVLKGMEPWTFKFRQEDREALREARQSSGIKYTKPDKEVTFDINQSLFRSGTNHDHDQPVHLEVQNMDVMERVNSNVYAKPETRYCPAGVYEYVVDDVGKERLHINAQNCLHCKACDIKDPTRNIKWTVPEGGGGPNYNVM